MASSCPLLAEAEDFAGLTAAFRDMSAKFLAAEEWLGQVAERVQRLEAVLFRTPVSSFLQIDKVIEELVQKTRIEIRESPGAVQVYVERRPGDDTAASKDVADDVFSTARDIGDELLASGCLVGNPLRPEVPGEGPSKSHQSCALSIGCISTDIGESSTDISVGNSSNIERLRPSDVTPRRASPLVRGSKSEQSHKHRASDWRDARDQACCGQAEGSREDVRADIFQEIDEWSALSSSMLDPTWTEPVPRGLEVVDEVSLPGQSSGSATPTHAELLGSSSPLELGGVDLCAGECQLSEDDRPWACSDRTPSPERQHDAVEDSIDERGRMIAHLIAENARLQALVEAQTSAAPSSCSSVVGGPAASAAESTKSKPRKLSKKERVRRQRRAADDTAPELKPP